MDSELAVVIFPSNFEYLNSTTAGAGSDKTGEAASSLGATDSEANSSGLGCVPGGERAFDKIGFKVDGLGSSYFALERTRRELTVGLSVDVVSVSDREPADALTTVVSGSSLDVLVGRKSLGDESVRCRMFVVAVTRLTGDDPVVDVSHSSTEWHRLLSADGSGNGCR